MTKRYTYDDIKKLYKFFGGIFGASLVINIINIILSNYYYLDSAAYELAELIFGGAGLFLGIASIMGIVPLVIILALVIVSVVFAVKQRDYKKIFNLGLWVTVALITVSAFLQNIILTEMV